jgi:hypothetical protein
MNDGGNVVQSPMNKQSPATRIDAACTNGSIIRTDNVSVVLDTTNWQITVTGAQAAYLGPTVVRGGQTVATTQSGMTVATTPFSTDGAKLIQYSILTYGYLLFPVYAHLFC